MTITENQRRTLDLMAESAGWNWADVEECSFLMFREHVSGLSEEQAKRLMAHIEIVDSAAIAAEAEARHALLTADVCLGWSRPCVGCGGRVCDDDAYHDGLGRAYHQECFGMSADDEYEDDDAAAS